MEMIAMDCHKRYSLAHVQTPEGQCLCEQRIEHHRGNIRGFLEQFAPGSPVAVETVGNWYWIVDEIEGAHPMPRLVHARKAKLMLGSINKSDKLDVRGLNTLQRAGTLPTVWIPPAVIRDQRELPRTRMVLGVSRTRRKTRLHSVLDKYGLQDQFEDISDIFGKKGRQVLQKALSQLPPQTAYTAGLLLEQLDQVEQMIAKLEQQMAAVFKPTPAMVLLASLPGVGLILSAVIGLEIGDIRRFKWADRLASYAGTVPRVHASGGKTRYGRTRPDVNHYLKWAYAEAANSVALNRSRFPHRHVSQLYTRLRARRGHAQAVGAVARHLAEATYWVLSKKEVYQERGPKQVLSKGR
ncbi:MAG: IS110 family transposase [Sedimentisphaerales bacterium]|nr:IS110 family transposase [Sedimentisphaerales bacterium]